MLKQALDATQAVVEGQVTEGLGNASCGADVQREDANQVAEVGQGVKAKRPGDQRRPGDRRRLKAWVWTSFTETAAGLLHPKDHRPRRR